MSNQITSKVINPKAGWYRGDFHTHTHASDGIYPADILAGIAKAEGLDFIAISDHNTITGLDELGDTQDFLVIPGLEITFDKGHFNVFGINGWQDWMEEICGDQIQVSMPARYKTINRLMQEISAGGLLNSINHPLLPPWDWLYGDTDLRHLHCLELWNDLYWPGHVTGNPAAVAMWTKWLNAGIRITAIGGSDYHYPPRPEEKKFGERLGMPATYVFADELSTAGVLDGLRKRRAYVTKGIQLDFRAAINGVSYIMGTDLGVQRGAVDFIVSIPYQPKPIHVHLVKNGEVIAQEKAKGRDIDIQFRHEVEGSKPDWFRLEITGQDGDVLAITNPFFFGPDTKPDGYQFVDFKP